MNNKLAIISVVFENYHILKDFFESCTIQRNKNYHLFLADFSTNKQNVPNNNLPLTIIPSKNLGYAHGANLGLKEAIKEGFEHFCVINNDIYSKENFVDNVLNSLVCHPSSIIGGKIYYAPKFEYHKSRYKKQDLGKVLWYVGGNVDWKNVYIVHRGVDEVDKGKYDQFEETDFITGCLIAFDKKVVDKVGFWDEDYFLYYEDADFCQRAKRKNIKLYYDPSIVIWHKNAQSTGGPGSLIHAQHQRINRLKFGLKYASLRTKFHLAKGFVFSLFKSS
jgi:GT2 family glycosyltransferase